MFVVVIRVYCGLPWKIKGSPKFHNCQMGIQFESWLCGLRFCIPMLPKPVASEKATSDFGLGVDLPR